MALQEAPSPAASGMNAAAQDLARDLALAALGATDFQKVMQVFCDRLVAMGVPLRRAYIASATLHPLVRARAWYWHGASGVVESEQMEHRAPGEEPQAWLESPFRHMLVNQVPHLSRRLQGQGAQLDFPVLKEFAEEGLTEWQAYAFGFGWELQYLPLDQPSRFAEIGMISSFSTDHAQGFSDEQREVLNDLLPILALGVKSAVFGALARDVATAYLGRDAAARVLAGDIRRGKSVEVDAVILYADLRGFTALADRLGAEPMLQLLNAYFDCLCPLIEKGGGDVLKFLGDGLLAAFQPTDGMAKACSAALDAAREAQCAVAALNSERSAQGLPVLQLDIALHRGLVMYGNIGTQSRLDFTLIGPAVNEAARIENLCGQLGRNLLASASFAEAAGAQSRLASLGFHNLRGVASPREIFAG